jgi:hypothetical protein
MGKDANAANDTDVILVKETRTFMCEETEQGDWYANQEDLYEFYTEAQSNNWVVSLLPGLSGACIDWGEYFLTGGYVWFDEIKIAYIR